MKKLQVCVCDDDGAALMTYAAAVKGSFQGFGVPVDVDTYTATSSLRTRLASISYDVIFLDIDMPREDGIAFAKWLRRQKNNVPVIFVTAREDRMFDTFAVQPFGFVRKSKFVSDLNETVRLFLEATPELSADMILFSTKTGGIQVNVKQVVYIESSLHVQHVYLYGQPEIEISSRMESIESLLRDKGFIRVHKGYIVNYRYIKRIENTEIHLTTGVSIPLARSKKKEAKMLWLEYGTKNGFTNIQS